jgi:hypothetical protein
MSVWQSELVDAAPGRTSATERSRSTRPPSCWPYGIRRRTPDSTRSRSLSARRSASAGDARCAGATGRPLSTAEPAPSAPRDRAALADVMSEGLSR